jgi:hypothetical protein
MKPDPIEPLPDDVLALLAREAEGYPEDPALAREVLGGVERAVLLSGAGSSAREALQPARASGGLTVRKIAALAFVTGALVGAGLVQAVHMRAEPAVPAQSSAPPVAEPPRPVVTRLEVPPAEQVPKDAHDTARASASVHPRLPAKQARPVSDLAREQQELAVARAALVRGRFDDALAATASHARTFPHGQLEEERELLTIQALAMAQRMDEAQAHAATFRRAFPHSVLLPAVDAALHSDVP